MSQFDSISPPEQNHPENVQYVYVRAGNPTRSLVFGICGLIAWIMPIVSLPLTIVGIIYGRPDVYGNGKTAARVGTILCIIGLCLTVVNMIIGGYLGATGQHPLIRTPQEIKQRDAD
jgi:hypothetical protein